MNSINIKLTNSQKMEFEARIKAIEYAIKNGYAKASRKYGYYRQTIHRWAKKYDGTLASILPKSRRPYSHKNQHTKKELENIRKIYNRYKSKGLRACI